MKAVAPAPFLAFALAACAHAPAGDGRATVEALNARLLANPSATLTLQDWCAERRLAPDPRIKARRGPADKPAPAEVRAALRIGPAEPVRYRQVQLVCGRRVLSEADNWYVPAQLTPEMNRTLDGTDTPFGVAVAALHFTRRNLSARDLMPEHGPAPAHVLEHSAILSTGAGVPFSFVVERYTSAVLD